MEYCEQIAVTLAIPVAMRVCNSKVNGRKGRRSRFQRVRALWDPLVPVFGGCG